jgi:DNA-binding response OmpR family regulator
MAKVLIVEDDAQIARMYLQAFTLEGFEVQIAANGRLGLDTAVAFQPDIILADVMMPVMNGIEMLADLKNSPDTKHIPVIILTNLSDVRTAEAALKQGALQYVVKSDYNPVDIIAIAKGVLNDKGKSEKPNA